MESVTSAASVIAYMTSEQGLKKDVAERLCQKFAHIVQAGIQNLAYPYTVAEEIVSAEEAELEDMLPEDYYENIDMEQ